MKSGHWLVFVEDPGAVNAIAPVVQKLVERQVDFRLVTDGQAKQLMRKRGFEPLSLAMSNDVTSSLIDESPALLVVGTSENPDTRAFDLIVAANNKAIPSVAIVDSGANSEHRFRGNGSRPLAYAPDWLLVPDTWTSKKFSELGFSDKKIVVTGDLNEDRLDHALSAFTKVGRSAVRRCVFPHVSAGQKILVFVSEISGGLNPDQYEKSSEYTLHGRGTSTARTTIVVEEVLDSITDLVAEGLPRPHLVLRLHPKETTEHLGKLINSFDEVSKHEDPLQPVFSSDVTVGMSSMLLVEAHRLGVPCLAVLPRASEREWLGEVRDGAIPGVTSSIELRAALRNFLKSRINWHAKRVFECAPRNQFVDRALNALETIAR